ncbi:MAG: Ig-like domain-containing protein, partial [Dehalococcoidia bacterium]
MKITGRGQLSSKIHKFSSLIITLLLIFGLIPPLVTVAETGQNENEPPVADDDIYEVVQGGKLDVNPPGVLSNDYDSDNDILTVTLISEPSSGSITFNSNGSFIYTHSGVDTAT